MIFVNYFDHYNYANCFTDLYLKILKGGVHFKKYDPFINGLWVNESKSNTILYAKPETPVEFDVSTNTPFVPRPTSPSDPHICLDGVNFVPLLDIITRRTPAPAEFPDDPLVFITHDGGTFTAPNTTPVMYETPLSPPTLILYRIKRRVRVPPMTYDESTGITVHRHPNYPAPPLPDPVPSDKDFPTFDDLNNYNWPSITSNFRTPAQKAYWKAIG